MTSVNLHGSELDAVKLQEQGVNLKILSTMIAGSTFKMKTSDNKVIQAFHTKDFENHMKGLFESALVSRTHLVWGELRSVWDWAQNPGNIPWSVDELAKSKHKLQQQAEKLTALQAEHQGTIIAQSGKDSGAQVVADSKAIIEDQKLANRADNDTYFTEKKKREKWEKRANFLAVNLQLSELILGYIQKIVPKSICIELQEWFVEQTKIDDIITSFNSKIVAVLNDDFDVFKPEATPWSKFERLPTVLARIHERYAISTHLELKGFHSALFNKTYSMRSVEVFKSYLNERLLVAISMLAGTGEALSNKDILTCVIINIEMIDRFKDCTQKLQDKFSTSQDLTYEELQESWTTITRADDHYWRTKDGAGKEPTIAFLGWNKKDSQQDKMEGHGKPKSDDKTAKNKVKTSDKSGGTASGSGSVGVVTPVKRKCNWCNRENHKYNECRDRENGKPQHPEAKARYESLKAKLDKRKAKKDSTSTPPKKKVKFAHTTANDDASDDGIDQVSHITLLLQEANGNMSFTATDDRPSSNAIDVPTCFDSGSNSHTVLSHPTEMTGMKKSDRVIGFGNKATLPIKAVGDIGAMKKVAVVPNMPINLISPGKLATDNGMISILTKKTAYVLRPGARITIDPNEVCFKAPLENGLYMADTKELWKTMRELDA
jgi:hypothetical protein